jgi:hypothetical protein
VRAVAIRDIIDDDLRSTERVGSRTIRRESRAASLNVSERDLYGERRQYPQGPVSSITAPGYPRFFGPELWRKFSFIGHL